MKKYICFLLYLISYLSYGQISPTVNKFGYVQSLLNNPNSQNYNSWNAQTWYWGQADIDTLFSHINKMSSPSYYTFYKGTIDTASSSMNSQSYNIYSPNGTNGIMQHFDVNLISIGAQNFSSFNGPNPYIHLEYPSNPYDNIGSIYMGPGGGPQLFLQAGSSNGGSTLTDNGEFTVACPDISFYGGAVTHVVIGAAYNSYDPSSVLDLESTTTGFLQPRMTTTQRNAIISPAKGLNVFDITKDSMSYFDGTKWNYLATTKNGGIGPTGPTGAQGATGPTGATGSQGTFSGGASMEVPFYKNSSTLRFSPNFILDTTRWIMRFGTNIINENTSVAQFGSSVNTYNQMTLRNASNGSNASSNYILENDQDTTNYLDMYFNSSTYTESGYSSAWKGGGGMYNNKGGLWLGTATNDSVGFFLNGTNKANRVGYFTTAGLTLANALTVPNGGTGIVTTTAYGLITGGTTSTGIFQNAGTGSSGQFYKSGGAIALGSWVTLNGVPALTAGGIVYGGKGGGMAQSSNFVWDTINNALLIGGATTAANTPLNILSNTNGNVYGIFKNSSVGNIATSNVGAYNASSSLELVKYGTGFTNSTLLLPNMGQLYDNGGIGLLIGASNGFMKFVIGGNSTSSVFMAANSSMNVAIGSTALVSTSAWLKLMGGTTTVAPLLFTSATPTTSAITGAEEYDGNSLWFTPIGTTRYSLPMTVYTATASQSDSNTTSETSIISGTGIGSLTIPANGLVAGRTIVLVVSGYYSSGITKTITINVKLGSTIICTTGSVSQPTSQTQKYFKVTATFTCRSTGSSGLVMGGGDFAQFGSLTDNGMPSVSPVTVNTTTSQAISVTATQGAGATTDVIVGTQATININN